MTFPTVDGVLVTIIAAIRESINQCPPDIIADIQESGLAVTGGGVCLHNPQTHLGRELELPAKLADDPLLSVARDCEKILNQPDRYALLEMPA